MNIGMAVFIAAFLLACAGTGCTYVWFNHHGGPNAAIAQYLFLLFGLMAMGVAGAGFLVSCIVHVW